jgi:hypothetical protein
MVRSSPDLLRLSKRLRELNPLWLLTVVALLLAVAASSVMRQHVVASERLQARLTGSALVDALRLYAEATPPGKASRPTSLAQLTDDQRSGLHRNWLDSASAEALAEPQRWQLLRAADGSLIGARQRPAEAGVVGGLFSSTTADDSSAEADGVPPSYTLEHAPPPAAAEPLAAAPLALPQPVLPDTRVADLAAAASTAAASPTLAQAAQGGAAAAGRRSLSIQTPAQAASQAAPGASQRPEGTAGLKLSRIIAGLEARQVLRLSSGDDDSTLTARHAPASAPAAKPPGQMSAPAYADGRVGAGPPAGLPAASGSRRQGKVSASRLASTALAKPVPAAASAPPHSVAQARAAPLSAPLAALRSPLSASPVVGGNAPVVAPASPLPLAQSPGPAVQPEGSTQAAQALAPLPGASGSVDSSAVPGAADATSVAPPPAAVATIPPARVDTVLYDDSQSMAGDPRMSDCRALSGDGAECDAFEDDDPGLYQRCYESLSERINACVAGEPIPALVTR